MRKLLCMLAVTLASSCAVAESITLTNGEWLPLQSETLPQGGVLSRIVSEAFALQGVTVRYVYRPWPRAFAEAQSGAAQGSIVWSEGAAGSERNRDFYFSDVVFEGKSVFFHRKGFDFSWSSYAELARYRVGGVAGYEYSFEQEPGMRIDRAPTDEMCMRKLLAKRFDVFPSSLEVGMYTLRRHFTPSEAAQITVHQGRPYNATRYHLILPRKLASSPRYIKLFNQGLQKLRSSGRYAEHMADLQAGRY
jgi:polar amino acid transport system substrate-binding protein